MTSFPQCGHWLSLPSMYLVQYSQKWCNPMVVHSPLMILPTSAVRRGVVMWCIMCGVMFDRCCGCCVMWCFLSIGVIGLWDIPTAYMFFKSSNVE